MAQTTTKYTVTGISEYGCKAKDSVTITIMPKPLIRASNDTVICGAGIVQLNVSGNANSYSWSPGANLSDSSIVNPIANVLSNSRYIVKAASLQGCNTFDTVNIRVSAIPNVKTNNDTTVCKGSPVFLYLFPTDALYQDQYQWLPAQGLSDANIANPVALPLQTTQYIITAKNLDGCIGKDSVLINVIPNPILSLINDTTICRFVSVELNGANNNGMYLWSPSTGLSNTNIANPIATPLETTTYSVTVKDVIYGCKSEGSVTINVRPRPNFSVSNDNEICFGSTTQLQAKGGNAYQWTPAESINHPDSNIFCNVNAICCCCIWQNGYNI
jgi:hypothetical protein